MRTMKGILKKKALTADKSFNSVLNSSPPIKCYNFTQFSWVFKNHVISQCQGLFLPAFLLGGEKPYEQGWPWKPPCCILYFHWAPAALKLVYKANDESQYKYTIAYHYSEQILSTCQGGYRSGRATLHGHLWLSV